MRLVRSGTIETDENRCARDGPKPYHLRWRHTFQALLTIPAVACS